MRNSQFIFAVVVTTISLLSISQSSCKGRAAGTCGNDVRDGQETCDGTDLHNHSCLSQGFGGGVLSCANDCRSFDTATCCQNECTLDMDTECDGDLHRTCEVQDNGCHGWTLTDCAVQDEHCYDYGPLALCVGTCESECDEPGETSCDGQVLRACVWEGACLRWFDTDCFPVECGGSPAHCIPSPTGRACDDPYNLDGVTFPHRIFGYFWTGLFDHPPSCSITSLNPLFMSYTITASEPALVTARITEHATSVLTSGFPTLAAYITTGSSGICNVSAREELACDADNLTHDTATITFDARDHGIGQGDTLYLLSNTATGSGGINEPDVELHILDCASPTLASLAVPPVSTGVDPGTHVEIVFIEDVPAPHVGSIEIRQNGAQTAFFDLAASPAQVAITERRLTIIPDTAFQLGASVEILLNLTTAACGHTVSETLSFDTAASALPTGEGCDDPIYISANGTTPIYWYEGNLPDVLNSSHVDCYSVSLLGNDSVFTFTMDATATNAKITIPKTPLNHLVAVLLESCGPFSAPVACETNNFGDTLVLDARGLQPGRQYFLVVGAISGFETFPDPAFNEITVQQYFSMDLLQEGFETWPIAGWTIEDLGHSGYTWVHCQQSCATAWRMNGPFMRVGYNGAPLTTRFDDRLLSPAFATHGFSAIYVNFRYYFRPRDGVEALVEYRVDSGPWQLAGSLIEDEDSDYAANLILPGAGHRDDVQVRFRYISQEWDDDWIVDEVRVIGVP